LKEKLNLLSNKFSGTLHFDALMKTIYSTDASIYKQMPLAVAYPKSKADIQALIHFATENSTSLIPRTAGTSLAGQCVGDGIVVDVSKHFTNIIELNVEEQWVSVEPGVVRDELNSYLAEHGLFFGPNTSTANRCMIGGMVGNNSSGTTSIKYGVTRDHVLELETVLSDGSVANFFKNQAAPNSSSFQSKIEIQIIDLLNEKGAREELISKSPRKSIHRRNTGYALDLLAEDEINLDLTKLLSGSEGTLAFTTAIKLNLDKLPPVHVNLVCAHFNSIHESMEAVLVAMKSEPYACELMDKIILDCTKNNIEQKENRFFVEGDPAAVLVIELRDNNLEELNKQTAALLKALEKTKLGYAFPVISGEETNKVWNLRAAGLGLLSNIPGDAKPIACIEDTAVDLNDLPAYIDEFEALMKSFDQEAVYYAHAGAGELHLRPILNLKAKEDREKFRRICESTAQLVKKYNGSLSGEHGDGRVRAEFIPLMVGEENYKRFQRVKQIWDPNNIFNPGKIVNALPIDEDLRYAEGQVVPKIETTLDFSENEGLLLAAEKCNGSADCRKITGAMCPSYQATKNEETTTRARANMLREVLTQNGHQPLPLANEHLKNVLDLCVSCKACKRECPSNVDMALMKSEFLHQYQKKNGLDFKSKLFGNIHKQNQRGMLAPGFVNFLFRNSLSSSLIKSMLGVAQERSLPALNKITFRKWFSRQSIHENGKNGSVYFFVDEFTNFNDLEVGQKAVLLLNKLGYGVKVIDHEVSGRTYISKGMLDEAKACAEKNVSVFHDHISESTPLIGLEPSALLTFRDEYQKLLRKEDQAKAKALAKNCLTIEEFLQMESQKVDLTPYFSHEQKNVKVHVHCHQKALSNGQASKDALSLPANYTVEIIDSSCCGMAGSFGYEKDHYEVSMQMGALKLFPSVKSANEKTLISASGTSCRHQIKDGADKEAKHPVEILYDALI